VAGQPSTGRRVERPRPDAVVPRRGDVVEEVAAAPQHRQPRAPCGHHWLTGRGALRYSLAVRARPRADWVPLDPRPFFGGGIAPSTYDLTK
jgi:hypothetical protein